VPDLTIQPTAKFVKAGAIAAGLVSAGAMVFWYLTWGPSWPMVLPLVLLLWPGAKALGRRFTKTTITGDRLRYETGVTSKTTRNIQLSKIQDVRVDQGLMQRIFNIGDLSIETAGETSRLTLPDVDAPQALADEIMNRVQKLTGVSGAAGA
jgi:uncharacterized membrane protein YdbT with pleckstrin-like domain